MSTSNKPTDHVDIAIVGGGISGLYCALELAKCLRAQQPLVVGGRPFEQTGPTPTVQLYEMQDRFGGRIETWTLDLKTGDAPVETVDDPYNPGRKPEEKHHFYRAEFGPMRIDPRDQPLLRDLLASLHIQEPDASRPDSLELDEDLVKFPAYASEEPREPKYPLTGEEAEQHSLLDLLMLAMRRIFELAFEDEPFRSGGAEPWQTRGANRSWTRFMGVSSVRRHYWKGELHNFINSLRDDDYAFIRREMRIDGTLLHRMGFWNLLSEVLSHLAVLRIRDWGSYYHMIGENPNAAEHLVMWLRAIRSSEALRGVRGGMGVIVDRLVRQLAGPECRRYVGLNANRALVSLAPWPHGGSDEVLLRFADGTSVVARHVILAMPRRPLERLQIPGIQHELDKVLNIPLLKVFFVIDQPWWEDDRPPNRFAGDLPTREVHYWKSRDKTRGVIMIYTDRPALTFWADYLSTPSGGEELVRSQFSATKWILKRSGSPTEPDGINERLWRRFVQYARDYEHNDFTMERLLACGIRDWGKDPYGAAVHLWKPRARSWEVADKFVAFSLNGTRENVHICGDAYSDYQGFVEGALRSTGRVLNYFRSGARSAEVYRPVTVDI